MVSNVNFTAFNSSGSTQDEMKGPTYLLRDTATDSRRTPHRIFATYHREQKLCVHVTATLTDRTVTSRLL